MSRLTGSARRVLTLFYFASVHQGFRLHEGQNRMLTLNFFHVGEYGIWA